mmetsp:Transcript_37748/g.70411  ORF Transcript_37748/g.70411 Transcript_37748/m.70411 type:complete len:187 (-) Transcript_37748:222-782(-)
MFKPVVSLAFVFVAVVSAARVAQFENKTLQGLKEGEKCNCAKEHWWEQTCCGEGLICSSGWRSSTCKRKIGEACDLQKKGKDCAGDRPYYRAVACRAGVDNKPRCCIRSISEARNVLRDFALGQKNTPLDNMAGREPYVAESCCSGFIEVGKGLGPRCNDPNNLELTAEAEAEARKALKTGRLEMD